MENHIDFIAGPSNSCIERVMASSIECLINILVEFNKVFEIGNEQKINNFINKYNEQMRKYKEI